LAKEEELQATLEALEKVEDEKALTNEELEQQKVFNDMLANKIEQLEKEALLRDDIDKVRAEAKALAEVEKPSSEGELTEPEPTKAEIEEILEV